MGYASSAASSTKHGAPQPVTLASGTSVCTPNGVYSAACVGLGDGVSVPDGVGDAPNDNDAVGDDDAVWDAVGVAVVVAVDVGVMVLVGGGVAVAVDVRVTVGGTLDDRDGDGLVYSENDGVVVRVDVRVPVAVDEVDGCSGQYAGERTRKMTPDAEQPAMSVSHDAALEGNVTEACGASPTSTSDGKSSGVPHFHCGRG